LGFTVQYWYEPFLPYEDEAGTWDE
jgi:hypothetical protein